MTMPGQISVAINRKRQQDARRENARRSQIEAQLAKNERDSKRLLDWVLEGIGDEKQQLAKVKDLGVQRDHLTAELEQLPNGNNIVVLPSAIEAFASRLKASRTKLHQAIWLLEDMGELSALIREIVDAITLFTDDEGVLVIRVESWLAPFIESETMVQNATSPQGAVTLVAEESKERNVNKLS